MIYMVPGLPKHLKGQLDPPDSDVTFLHKKEVTWIPLSEMWRFCTIGGQLGKLGSMVLQGNFMVFHGFSWFFQGSFIVFHCF